VDKRAERATHSGPCAGREAPAGGIHSKEPDVLRPRGNDCRVGGGAYRHVVSKRPGHR
jgi:hypothetical protein